MCACDTAPFVCPAGCKYRPGGAEAWSGHDRYEQPTLVHEPERGDEPGDRDPAEDGRTPW